MSKRVLIFTITLFVFFSCLKIEKSISSTKYVQEFYSDHTDTLAETGDLNYAEQDPPQKTQGNKSSGSGGKGESGSTEGTGSPEGQRSTSGTETGGTGESGSTEGPGSVGNSLGEGSGTDSSGETGTNSTGNKSNFELQVEPDRKIIYSGEQTSIQIDLHEVDPEGNENLSCAGKEVFVRVTGLVDGTISHKSGKISLNEVGVAFIDYRAGQKDKQIKIIATFNPGSGTSDNPGNNPTNPDGTTDNSTTDTSPGSQISDNPGTNPQDLDGKTDNSTTDTSPRPQISDNPGTNPQDSNGTSDNSSNNTSPGTPTGNNPGTNPPNPNGTSDNSSNDTSPGAPTGDNPGTNPPNPNGTSDNSSNDTSPGAPTGDNPGTNPPNPNGTSDNSSNDTSPGAPTGDNPVTNPPDPNGTSDNNSNDTSPGAPTGDNPVTNPPDPNGTSDNNSNDTSPGAPTGDNPVTNPPDPDGTSGHSSTELSPGSGTGQGSGTTPTNQSGKSGTGPNEESPAYSGEVEGEATINIKPLEYEATLTVKGTYRKTVKSSYKKQTSDGVEDGTHDMQERRQASFYVPLKMENAGDMPVLNQRWEYYRPLDINLSSFNASYRERRYSHGQGKSSGYRTTVTITKSPVGQKVAGKDFLLQSNIVLVIDKKTEKVVKVISGYSVEFKWQGSRTMFSENWSPDSRSSDSDAEPIEEEDTFEAEPVEDPIPDPTFSSVSQSLKTYFKDMGIPLPSDVEIPEDEDEKPEISPDYLVKTGDGKTFFGGSGEKIKDQSKGGNTDREEQTFSWNMTRKKKPL